MGICWVIEGRNREFNGFLAFGFKDCGTEASGVEVASPKNRQNLFGLPVNSRFDVIAELLNLTLSRFVGTVTS
jgi:hypothetical protein